MAGFVSKIVEGKYAAPISPPRKGWRRRIEVFSPKISRRVCLGSYLAYQTWIMLEANPRISNFCERPALMPGPSPPTIDFWVRFENHQADEFWVIQRAANTDKDTLAHLELPTHAHCLAVREIKLADIERNALPISNWGKIIPFIVANIRWRDPLLEQSLIVFLGQSYSLQAIIERFADRDPTEVQAALFVLIAQGRLVSGDLALKPLGHQTQFRRA